jgi:phosphoribosylaminoimidazolecarboxamide formyltransferase/IMP cyclohydrolase
VSYEARTILGTRAAIRVLELGDLRNAPTTELEYRSVTGGLLAQTRDSGTISATGLRVVTQRAPTHEEHADLMFAWRVCKFVKSNAIVYARERATVGVGAGQMSRVYSSRIAALKAADAKLSMQGAVMASDAYFPFRDAVDLAAEHGIRAVIQPGGSKRDDEVIAAADECGIAMIFTGMRHFRH